jgi:hypothetical protein
VSRSSVDALRTRPTQSSRQLALGRLLAHGSGSADHVREFVLLGRTDAASRKRIGLRCSAGEPACEWKAPRPADAIGVSAGRIGMDAGRIATRSAVGRRGRVVVVGGYGDRVGTRSSLETVSATATATSTAPAAAIPAMSVSGAVATARIASAASPSDRDGGTRPSALYQKKTWPSRNRPARRTSGA